MVINVKFNSPFSPYNALCHLPLFKWEKLLSHYLLFFNVIVAVIKHEGYCDESIALACPW